jgi:UDP-N-acetylmuramate dehydrogenase
LNTFEISGQEIYAECGVSIIALAMISAKEGLSGLEFASGIPGLIGGAIFMNAGAYKKSMANVISEVLVYKDKEVVWLKSEELDFAYRHSIFMENRDWLILAVRLKLTQSQPEKIQSLIMKRKAKRMETQPYDAYSAGSVFKNPEHTNSWQLIDKAGLRGYRINDAHVSIKHPNFIINADRASAKDIYSLINYVRDEVKALCDVTLKVEIELVNFDE